MKENYLAEEKIGKLMLKFCLPCIFSLIISCLYNLVDQIFVGNGVGPLANAATGVIFPITVIGWGLSLLFGDGASANLSISLGKNEPEKIHRYVGCAMLGSFLTGGILILVAYLWGDDLLMLLGGTQANISLCHEYGVIIYAMIPLALVQNCLASIIRADGSPKFAMIAMSVGAVLNMILDPTFIFAFHLGIGGAAWATIIGQFVSFILCICYLKKSKTFHLTFKSFLPDLKVLGDILKLGLSSFFTQLCIVATTIVNNVLFVKYGALWDAEFGSDAALSAFVVIMKLFQIILNVAIGIGVGALPIVGYNMGAKRYDRVRKLFKYILLWTAGVTLAFTIILEVFPGAFVAMFGAAKGEGRFISLYKEFAVNCLRIYLMFISLGCVQKVCAIFLQSMGYAKISVPLSFLRDLLVILFAFLLPLSLGVLGVAWAAPVSDALSLVVTLPFMIYVIRKLKSLEKTVSDGEISGINAM